MIITLFIRVSAVSTLAIIRVTVYGAFIKAKPELDTKVATSSRGDSPRHSVNEQRALARIYVHSGETV